MAVWRWQIMIPWCEFGSEASTSVCHTLIFHLRPFNSPEEARRTSDIPVFNAPVYISCLHLNLLSRFDCIDLHLFQLYISS